MTAHVLETSLTGRKSLFNQLFPAIIPPFSGVASQPDHFSAKQFAGTSSLGPILQGETPAQFGSNQSMTTIRVKENEPFDVALRRFKRTIEKLGLLTDLRAREFYEKPTAEIGRAHV